MRSKELKDLTVSSILLALAFGIAFSGGLRAFLEPVDLGIAISLALIGVSLGFILHELAHRFVARRFGCSAEYVMWPAGLGLALVFSMFGFVLAAPGAVMIRPGPNIWGRAALTRKSFGLISIAGPAMNICLAIIFILLNTLYPSMVFTLGARINTWLAIFNLIPFGPLDGAKILNWDKSVWVGALLVAVGLLVMEFFVL
jgi:Zn-dependent protease